MKLLKLELAIPDYIYNNFMQWFDMLMKNYHVRVIEYKISDI
jgi:hypothetical protein